ncbi:tRNA (5-methylaminomethyl-2-thiouridine)(34)-methyltransferase MnmD [Fulvivirgaceae bacterium PWU4]|uniref:tRNA (5-methylaminomethyl-2-thiouridine)(34)-methyltransferase MnmD n=1 Tax=Chryseosolibacter histidini TaxID=2782349 RepID=A0AAP2DPV6_9BACT|nr:tRNA (5-methylaminomethyl-2-thiouridine)(34)-methyltransferase MnmD [Chryseosolibacter histidini]MBT1700310.1 tRNA (5-methylaminomethyl-2-thiouridine)(34)-methyltransferase MnmD [Chryseosolibacter histidini]
MSQVSIITTTDGSHSLLNTSLNETYHSVHGALQESKHVFVRHGLDFFCERSSVDSIHIFEMGFGTGLNALLTAQRAAETQRHIHYTTLETFPLDQSIWKQLNYADTDEAKDLFQRIHEADWNKESVVTPFFTQLKMETSLQQATLTPAFFDVVYYDAFAPNKQPELWEMELLRKVVEAMKTGGIFVTYCAKGQLKRDLKSLQLSVETLAGPPGKKEMVRALKI